MVLMKYCILWKLLTFPDFISKVNFTLTWDVWTLRSNQLCLITYFGSKHGSEYCTCVSSQESPLRQVLIIPIFQMRKQRCHKGNKLIQGLTGNGGVRKRLVLIIQSPHSELNSTDSKQRYWRKLKCVIEIRILDSRPKYLGFHMSGLATTPYIPNKEIWWKAEKGNSLHGRNTPWQKAK
jgi:hypothetical protein